jgi:hypothetical protein
MGTIGTWEPLVPGNHLYMGIICTWEPFVPGNVFSGNQIYPGVLFAGALFQEPFCSGTLLPVALFAGTLLLGTFRWERFGRNVLAGTLLPFPRFSGTRYTRLWVVTPKYK